jgi:hypothetical protein
MRERSSSISAIAAFLTAIDNTLEAQTAASSDAEAKAQGRLYLQQALASLPPLFAKAGTSFTVSDSYTRAPDLSSTLAGKLDAAAGAPFGFLGHMTLSLTGMDELIAKLQETARVSGDPKAAGFAQMLILAQLSGQADKAPDGKSRRTYALELKPDGITLNGVDMRAMLPGTPGAPPSATP